MRSYKSQGSLDINKDIDKPLLGSPNRQSKINSLYKISEEGDNLRVSRRNSRDFGDPQTTLIPVERQDIGEVPQIVNNTDKAIDFNAQMEKYKERTESQFPYTLTQTEDAMYLDSTTICTLEYHYIQNDCKYSQLLPVQEHINADGKLVDVDGNPREYMLHTQNYQPLGEPTHPMSIFPRKDITNYDIDETGNVFEDLWKTGDRGGLMEAHPPMDRRMIKQNVSKGLMNLMGRKRAGTSPDKGEKNPEKEPIKLQPFIGIYKITAEGKMARANEFTANFGRRNYHKARDGSMMLTRSRDKRFVSIVNFDPLEKDDDFFSLNYWNLREERQEETPYLLNQALNRYYMENQDSFDKLVEVSICDKSRLKVQLVYIEVLQRSLQEQLDYELEIQQQQEAAKESNQMSSVRIETQKKREEPRKAKKYVFFDLETGEFLFEYGGVHAPLIKTTKNANGDILKQREVFMLGLQVKELRDDKYPKLLLFMAGDFLDSHVKKSSINYKWAFWVTQVNLHELMRKDTAQERIKFIDTQILNEVPRSKDPVCKYYFFDDRWINQQKFNWEMSIDVTTNRKFDQFLFINQPINKNPNNPSAIMVNGPRFNKLYKTDKSKPIEVPYYNEISNDVIIQHSRNSFIKEQLFYHQTVAYDIQTYCLRFENSDQHKRIKRMQIPLLTSGIISTPDPFIQFTKVVNDNIQEIFEMFQLLSVSQGDQTASLKTQLPIKQSGLQKKVTISERLNSQFYQQSADLPFICYNLGSQRLMFTCVMNPQIKRTYILNIPDNEKFVCFVDHNTYTDIGFYPSHLRMECCSHFLYLTTSRNQTGDVHQNRLNLLLIDPYYEQIQVAIFKSSSYIDNSMFKVTDFPVKCFVQATTVRKDDQKFSHYIWTQFYDSINRSKILRTGQRQIDSDNDVDEGTQHDFADEIVKSNQAHNLPNPMIQDSQDFIYYIVSQNGICKIMEGNPRDPYYHSHTAIFETKAEDCLAFTLEDGVFYFMDDNYIVYKLTRNDNNRFLNIECELTMKEIQKLDYQPKGIKNVILKDKYSIYGAKTFFLHDCQEDSNPEGIFEAEDLIQEDRNKPKVDTIKGPFQIRGTRQFYNVFRKKKFDSFFKVFSKPDSYQRVLFNDYLNFVDFSTFLPNGKILIKIRRRYCIFSASGDFIDDVEFTGDEEEDDYIDPNEENSLIRKGMKSRRMFLETMDNELVKTLEDLRRGKEPILDFHGDPYKFKQKRSEETISQMNKLELMQCSPNNRFFLFLNRLSEKLFIYELCEMKKVYTDNPDQEIKKVYQFQKYTEVKTDKSYMFQHMYMTKVDPIRYFKNNKSQIVLTDEGVVKLCFIEILPSIERQQDDAEEKDEGSDVNLNMTCRVVGAVFEPNVQQKVSNSEGFNQIIELPKEAIKSSQRITEQRIYALEQKIKAIRNKQSRLPPKLFCYQQYESLIEDLEELEFKQTDTIHAKIFCENLLIVSCGSFLKYGRVLKNKEKAQKNSTEIPQELILKNFKNDHLSYINLRFGADFEIVKIIETIEPDIIQIVTMNYELSIMQITSWDFVKNMEKTMLQLVIDQNSDIGSHVVRGMNSKMNYFIDKKHVIDMEFNIPIWQRNVDQNLIEGKVYNSKIKNLSNYLGQNKLYQDNTRFLGVERAGCLFYNLNKLDILFWQNVSALGEKQDIIEKSATLQNLNLVFDGTSVFHYFAAYADIIETFHKLYKNAEQNDQFTGTDRTLPLQIINPNNNDQSALYLALANQSPKSFECMINLLKDFSDVCTTKMMLKTLSKILSHENLDVISFFDQAIYQPPLMKMELFVPWIEGMEEFVFPSHTALISKDLLLQKLEEKIGLQSKEQVAKKKKMAEDDDSAKQQIIEQRKLKSMKLVQGGTAQDASVDNDDREDLKRVNIEALDFDWIFEHGNAKKLLRVLANDANNAALTTKTIKIFIDLMWEQYKMAIVKWIFIPYIIYHASLILLSSGIVGELVGAYADIDFTLEVKEADVKLARRLEIQAYSLWCISFFLMICFASLEIKQFSINGLAHFSDIWNTIDAISITLNIVFLAFNLSCIIMRLEFVSLELTRTIGGFCNFFMWIKVFYWMRIFSSLAYYVNLIQQTISDSLNFMMMCLIIIIAFANFFYTLDPNFKDQEGMQEKSYFDTYYNNKVVDALLSIYELSVLSNYDITVYREGYDKLAANVMFFLSTFLITVVFMNMLIAIMGDTFSVVQGLSIERGLREQVVLIDDHIWLLNLDEIFKGQKYIILVKPGLNSGSQSDVAEGIVKETESNLTKMMTRLQTIMQTKIDSVQANTRFMLSHQNSILLGTKIKIGNIENGFKKTEASKEKNTRKSKKSERNINAKKVEMVKSLNSQIMGSGSQIDIDSIYEIVVSWMEIADSDKSGTIEFNEFYEFFSKFDGCAMNDEEIRYVFDEIDESGNGSLSAEEFAKGCMSIILNSQNTETEEPIQEESDEDY